MKKIFTLLAVMLFVCGSVSAQKKWTSVIVNGDMEGAQDPMWSSFWVHDWRAAGWDFNPDSGQQYDSSTETETSPGQFQGFAQIVEDPANASNHCARVIIRSKEEADAAGNTTTDSGNNKPDWAEWDSQFFIYATDSIPQGKQVRLTMKVKGEKAGTMQTQAHFTPGNYNHYQLFGDIEYGTEWTSIEVEAIVSADHTQASSGKGFQSVAFNLSTMQDGNTVYFDDIKLEVKDQDSGDDTLEGYVNFLRKGTLSADKINSYTSFTGRDGKVGQDVQARVVNDPVDGQPALNVTTIGWNASSILKNAEGTDSLDAEGEPVYGYYYIKEEGDTLKNSQGNYGMDDWQTQFFATVKHAFKEGENYKFVLWGRAARVDGQPLEEEISIDTQVHTMPGQYKHYDFVGSLSLNEEWQRFEFGNDDEPRQIASQANGCQTVAFNCNKYKDHAVELYFRFEELSFEKKKVVDSERALDTEAVTLPLAADEEPIVGKIDMNNALTALGVDKPIYNFIDSDKPMKFIVIDPETESEKFVDVDLSAGPGIDADGHYTSDMNSIILETNEDESKDGILAINISNCGVALEAGKSIDTKFAVEHDFWRYVYNVSFIDKDVYTGVSEVKAESKANTLYDLMGRQLNKAAKGLYIMNGKKVLVK